jgi:hypothetical protein
LPDQAKADKLSDGRNGGQDDGKLRNKLGDRRRFAFDLYPFFLGLLDDCLNS